MSVSLDRLRFPSFYILMMKIKLVKTICEIRVLQLLHASFYTACRFGDSWRPPLPPFLTKYIYACRWECIIMVFTKIVRNLLNNHKSFPSQSQPEAHCDLEMTGILKICFGDHLFSKNVEECPC